MAFSVGFCPLHPLIFNSEIIAMNSLRFVLIVVILSVPLHLHATTTNSSSNLLPFTIVNNTYDTELDIYSLINRERTRRDLKMLVWDDRLANIARSYSRQMAIGGFFAHADPAGKMVQDRVWNARLHRWKKVGENLFWVKSEDDFRELAVRRWMDSPTHRENVLDDSWTSTGIGIWQADNGRFYVTQVFLSD